MAIETFIWPVRTGATESINIATQEIQFGDGYKQVAGVGINEDNATWELSCNGKLSDMAVIRAFLKFHVTKSFWWSNPWGERKLYRVKRDSIKPVFTNGDFAEISFVFEQAYAP